MPNLSFNCPNCDQKGKITLMGEDRGVFEKKCKECGNTIEVTVENSKLKKTKINKKYFFLSVLLGT